MNPPLALLRCLPAFFLAALLASPVFAGLREADAKFDKDLYQEALGEYAKIAEKARSEEVRGKALYRACESEALLFRYGEAVKRLNKARRPKSAIWRARFLILKTELYREYLKQYGLHVRRDVVEDDKEVFRLTPGELRAEVEKAYWELWKQRKLLARRRVGDEAYFVDVDKTDRVVFPTMLDFVIHRWTDYLLKEAELPSDRPKPKRVSFIRRNYKRRISRGAHPTELAGALMEYAWRTKGTSRRLARELWRGRRLFVGWGSRGQIPADSDRENVIDSAAAILVKWAGEFKTNGGRAAAKHSAAELYNGASRFDEAVGLCEEVGSTSKWPETLGGRKCEKLLARIRKPTLSLSAVAVPPPGREALSVTSRNLKTIYFRMYKTSPEDLMETNRRIGDRNRGRRGRTWSSTLNRPEAKLIEYFLSARDPAKSWSSPVKAKSIYQYASFKEDLPDMGPGLYFVAASGDKSFEPGASLLFGAIVNVTDLVLVGTAGMEGFDRDFIFRPDDPRAKRTANGFHFYLLNGRTGKAVAQAPIFLKYAGRRRDWTDDMLKTDAHGRAEWPVTVDLWPRAHNSFRVDPLAQEGDHWAYWANPSYLGFSVPAHIRMFAETDRPIYRPGQTVRYKITVTERMPRGFRSFTGKEKVKIQIRDVNYQEAHKASKRVGTYGTLSGEFRIPTGRLLGRYTITARISVAGRNYSATLPFSVEEYKRPEFEATLDDAEGAWRFGKEAKVSGKVRYYFGGPVPDAAVTYKVYRENYIPWFCWWWSWRFPGGGREEILSAQTRTDEEGMFSFTFTPHPKDKFAKDPFPARFSVEVAARDAGGRTIKTEKSFLAGKNAYLFKIEPGAGFASVGKAHDIDARLVNLNGDEMSGRGEYTLYRLDENPEAQTPSETWGGRFSASPSLEQIYAKVENGESVSEGVVWFHKDKAEVIQLKNLESGAYRLTLKAEDPWGMETKQSIIVLAADFNAKTQPLKIHSLSLPEYKEYVVGETARMLIGSSELDALTHVEIWGGSFLLERRALIGGGVRAFTLPLRVKHKGGVTVRWFGVKDFKSRSGALTLNVPWKEKELKVRLKYDKVLKPGQEVKWSLTARDSKKRKVNGEATVRMYDRSLEYYAKGRYTAIASLYSLRPRPNAALGSVYTLSATQIRIVRGVIKKIFELFHKRIEEPMPPALRLNRSRVYGGGWGGMLSMAKGGAVRGAAMSTEYVLPGTPRPSFMVAQAKNADKMAEREEEGAKAPTPPEVKVRKDFSESAVFEPHLRLKGGVGVFKFKAPERLTSWKVSGHVITRDLKYGNFSEEAVTRKDLMVRVEMPRFFREGDKGTLKAVVHNETDAPLKGTVTLSVLENGEPAEGTLGLKILRRTFEVRPHGLEAFAWTIDVPFGIRTFLVRAVVRSGKKVDAEERELPILPSRQRLIESLVMVLNGDANKSFVLKSLLESDPSRRSEFLQLQIDPQLILTVLNAIPFLVRYPYECVEQTLNRYVPLAIVSAVYKNHPAIASAARKIPKRTTITPAWEADDPKRLTRLMETPWLRISSGRKSPWPVIDVLDAKVVAAQKKDALVKLRAAQLPGGGFPWFPGGRADPYMTLLVLAGFSEASHYGVEMPKEVVRKGLGYVMREIPLHLKPKKRHIALALYASYVVTSFPKALGKTEIPEFGPARKMARVWLDYADKHRAAMTKLGKAYAAYAYWRLGLKKKGDLYLKRAMDGAREDEISGVYWQPEKNSWLWYHDTLETHAFLLRMLQTLRPKDKRIPGLVQWLIFNRKGSEWKSTKASAAAVFTLLDFLKKRGALEKGDDYSIDWGDVKDSVQVRPEDWMEKPLRWTRRGSDITPEYAKPKISKKGPGLAFASLTHVYSTEKLSRSTEDGMLNIHRKFYRRVKQGKDYRLKLLKLGDRVRVGDEIEVRLIIRTRSQFEYVHIKDPRGAGFEAEALKSGWKWDQLSRYEEPRDSLTNFFVSWLPHGEYVLRYRVRPTTPGTYRIGAAVMQSMYAPEFAAHSSGFTLKVVE